MRKRGKIFGGLLAAVMLTMAPLGAYAADTGTGAAAAKQVDPISALTPDRIVQDLGVLKGDGDGVTDAYLAQRTTRLQAAILYLRLIGKEVEALAYSGTEGFADSMEAGTANRPVLAYLKAHPELGWNGTTAGRFEPNAPVTSQQMYKVLLEALGYSSGQDFAFKDTLAFAATKGLWQEADAASFANRNLAGALVEALQAMPKGGDATLGRKLADAGAIPGDKAAELEGSRVNAGKADDGTVYLTDGEGRALYLYTKDMATLDSCQEDCLANWPVFSADKLILSDGLNAADFGVHVRPDGTKQVTYQGWPLYYFIKDKAGDRFGEGIGGVWFLIKQPFYSAAIGTDDKLGNYLTDSQGRTLYYYDMDPSGTSVCEGTCLANWPAFHADSGAVPVGLNPDDFGEITRADGTKQTTFKGYPLYYFVKDGARGNLNGQGVGDVWFVVDPAKFDGTTAGKAQKG
ncbi:hypothetical protein [Cohnella zeiphila]|uniref:Lipoprotein n=1 Tax=Cohnella zeiphila TaxID=2761120 RepID=A0A7X0SHR8_9BACL|nr:hypothetical protein [Cohnella zeiphila]MBB6730189.1 hypothetical protein [Cohnella zeiphila]